MSDRLLTAQEAAEILRCHEKTVRRLAYDREHHAETRARTIRTEREAAGQLVIEEVA